jgi:TRAP-type C4-dicarboxylate transport system permease small subunit
MNVTDTTKKLINERMKKVVEIYSKISCAIALIVCISLGVYALMAVAEKNSDHLAHYPIHKNMFWFSISILFIFALFNGSLLCVASVHLLLNQKSYQ